ncbi:MAG: hypothetical protein AAGB24_12995 [Bacteroidota bacterium]
MKNYEEAVRIDVSKTSLHVSCHFLGTHKVFANDLKVGRRSQRPFDIEVPFELITATRGTHIRKLTQCSSMPMQAFITGISELPVQQGRSMQTGCFDK